MRHSFATKLKKLIVIYCFIFSSFLFAEPLKQFQTFNWKPVPKAKSYEIAIQKKNDDETFTPIDSIRTKDTKLEYLLLPGDYQVQIRALNVLGKKASSSPWINFVILDEKEPYLEKQDFPIDKEFFSPVIFLNNQKAAQQNEQRKLPEVSTTDTDDATDSDNATDLDEAIDSENTIDSDIIDSNAPVFRIKGINIFFEETRFSLVPRNDNPKGTMPLPFVAKDREEIPVKILSRDSENKNVQITFDPEKIHSGYYNLKVSNPNGFSDQIPILFIAGHLPKFEAANPLDYDRQYEAYPITVVKTKDTIIKLHGYDFEYGTDFQFIPSDGIPYPFASEKERQPENIELTKASYITDLSSIENQKQAVTFSLNGLNLETGYYDLIAKVNDKEERIHCLITAVAPSTADLPTIESIKSKYSKKAKTITLTMKGKNLTEQTKMTMVSPSVEGEKVSKKIPLIVEKVKKTEDSLVLTLEVDAEMVEPEIYGLLIDTGTYTNIDFLKFDDKFKAEKITLTDEEITKLFEFKDKIAETAGTLVVSDNPFFSEGNWIGTDYLISDGKGNKANIYVKEIDEKQRLVLRIGPRPNGTNASFYFAGLDKIKQSGSAVRFKVYSPHNDVWRLGLRTKNTSSEIFSSEFKVYGESITQVTMPLRDIKIKKAVEQLQYISSTDNVDCMFFIREQENNIFLGGRIEVFDFEIIDDLTQDDDPIYNNGWKTTNDKTVISTKKEDTFSFSHSKKEIDSVNCKISYDNSTHRYTGNPLLQKYTNTSIPTVKALQEADGFCFNIISGKKPLQLIVNLLDKTNKDLAFSLNEKETTVDINYLENNIDKNNIKGLQFSFLFTESSIINQTMKMTKFQFYKIVNGQKIAIDFNDKNKTFDKYNKSNSEKIAFEGKITSDTTEPAYFLPYIGAKIGYTNNQAATNAFPDNLYFLGEVTLFDAKWIGFDIDSAWNMDTSAVEVNGKIRLALPLISWLKPYVGAGFGMLFPCLDDTEITMQIPFFAGITLWNWLDLRYDCNLKNAQKLFFESEDFYPLFLQDRFSIGFKIPIRKRINK